MIVNFFGDYANSFDSCPGLSNELKDILNQTDYNVINVEAPFVKDVKGLYPIKKSGSILHQSIKNGEWLKEQGFNVFTVANNHLMDYGELYAKSTIDVLGDNCVGYGEYDDVLRPLIIQKDGVSCAILSVSHHEFGVVSDQFDKKATYGVAWAMDPRIYNEIHSLSKVHNHVIVIPHCGVEHIEQPLPEWRNVYKSYIDAGAHAIIASHPHITQGWEYYKGYPIYYSLGNFYFPSAKPHGKEWYQSIGVQLSLTKTDVNAIVLPLEFNDTMISKNNTEEFRSYLTRINNVLENNDTYIRYIDSQCNRLLDVYIATLAIGGWEGAYRPVYFIKRFLKILLNKAEYKQTNLINNIRCESHRWAIARALKHKINVQ